MPTRPYYDLDAAAIVGGVDRQDNADLLAVGQLGASAEYAFDDVSYTLIGPFERGWYTIVALDAACTISPQGDDQIAVDMDSDDASATPYEADVLDRFAVNSDGTAEFLGPDDRYIAIKAASGTGAIRIRAMRAGVALP